MWARSAHKKRIMVMKLRDKTETEIVREICQYLTARNIFHWRDKSGHTGGKRYGKSGVADILGIYKGRPLAIEVKCPNGATRSEQYKFLTEFQNRGGIQFIARSLEEVMERLK